MIEQSNSFESHNNYRTDEVTPDNYPLLATIRGQIDNKKTSEELLSEAEKYSRAQDRKAFITQEGDEVIGFVQLKLEETKLPEGAPETTGILELAHLARIGVSTEHTKKGIASSLLSRAEEYAQSKGKKGMWLDYLAENMPAMRLYASAGYKDLIEFRDKKDRLRRITTKYFQ